jgi:integrase
VFRPDNRADRASGNVLSEKVVWQLIKPYAETAGVPGIAPHDLRRTCAKLCRAGVLTIATMCSLTSADYGDSIPGTLTI